MKKPLPFEDAGYRTQYPTLSDFICDRRRFLKTLTVGTLSIGAGACLLGTPRAAIADDDNDNLPGTAPEPEYFSVRLPAEENGSFSVYIGKHEYVQFHIDLRTLNKRFAVFCQSAQDEMPDMLAPVLQEQTCQDLTDPQKLPDLETALGVKLEECFQAEMKKRKRMRVVEALGFVVDSCDHRYEETGDSPEPFYP